MNHEIGVVEHLNIELNALSEADLDLIHAISKLEVINEKLHSSMIESVLENLKRMPLEGCIAGLKSIRDQLSDEEGGEQA